MTCPRTLRGAKGAVIDTNVLIYLFEDHPRYGALAEAVIDEAASETFTGVITPITAGELLVKPLQQHRTDVADAYRSAMSHMRGISLMSIDYRTGVLAGALRARYGLPFPDMLQVAVALRSNPAYIITNDRALEKVAEVKVVRLEAFA